MSVWERMGRATPLVISLKVPYPVDPEIVFPPTNSSVPWFIPSFFD